MKVDKTHKNTMTEIKELIQKYIEIKGENPEKFYKYKNIQTYKEYLENSLKEE